MNLNALNGIFEMHDIFFTRFIFILRTTPSVSLGEFPFASRCLAFRFHSTKLRTFAKQNRRTNIPLILPFLTLNSNGTMPLVFCFEERENPQQLFIRYCYSFRALPKPANGQPVGSQIFKPPTPDLRGMPLRLAQTNGVCLNQ